MDDSMWGAFLAQSYQSEPSSPFTGDRVYGFDVCETGEVLIQMSECEDGTWWVDMVVL